MKMISVGKMVEPFPEQTRFLLVREGVLRAYWYDIAGLAGEVRKYLESGYQWVKNDVPDILCLDAKIFECQRLTRGELRELMRLLKQ